MVTVRIQNRNRTCSPGCRTGSSTAVKIRMNTTGFMPRKRLQRDMGEGDGQGQHTGAMWRGEGVLGQEQGPRCTAPRPGSWSLGPAGGAGSSPGNTVPGCPSAPFNPHLPSGQDNRLACSMVFLYPDGPMSTPHGRGRLNTRVILGYARPMASSSGPCWNTSLGAPWEGTRPSLGPPPGGLLSNSPWSGRPG